MGSYTVEQVEFLRQRADITYEETLEVLERCNGNLTRCLVDLERRGLIRRDAGQRPDRARADFQTQNVGSRRADACEAESAWGGLLRKLMNMRLVVAKDARTYVDLPVWYLAIAALCAPHLMIFTVAGMFVFGLKIRVETGRDAKNGNDRFYNTVDKVADDIRNAVNHFARAAQEGTEKARRGDAENRTTCAPQDVPEEDAAPAGESMSDADIPEVTPYEEFDGTEMTDSAPTHDEDENEVIIG